MRLSLGFVCIAMGALSVAAAPIPNDAIGPVLIAVLSSSTAQGRSLQQFGYGGGGIKVGREEVRREEVMREEVRREEVRREEVKREEVKRDLEEVREEVKREEVRREEVRREEISEEVRDE